MERGREGWMDVLACHWPGLDWLDWADDMLMVSTYLILKVAL